MPLCRSVDFSIKVKYENKEFQNSNGTPSPSLQNSPYFCVLKYTRAVKQKVWNEAENREPEWGETLRACEARALRARKTLTPRFTDFFTDFEKKTLHHESVKVNLSPTPFVVPSHELIT